MSTIARSNVSLATKTPTEANRVGSGLIVGADVAAGDVCYIETTGLVYPCDGTASDKKAKVRGVAPIAGKVAQSDAITLLTGVDLNYSAGLLTPGMDVFVDSAVPGALSTVATTGGTAPCGFAIDSSRVRFFGTQY